MTYYCFYCSTHKPREEFNDEHGLSKAFGEFGVHTPIFSEEKNCRVCEECNNKFGRELENPFCANSHEGIERFLKKQKDPKKFDSKRLDRKSTRIIIKGFLSGLIFKLEKDARIFEKDIGFRKKENSYDFFTINEIENESIDLNLYPPHENRFLCLNHKKETRIIEILRTKWPEENIIISLLPLQTLDTLSFIEYDKNMLRALVKNAFNYFAWVNNQEIILSHASFDPIRKFVKDDIGKPGYFIKPTSLKLSISDYHHSAYFELTKNGEIYGLISFFNQILWKVNITNGFTGILLKNESSHIFNPFNKTMREIPSSNFIILPLETSLITPVKSCFFVPNYYKKF